MGFIVLGQGWMSVDFAYLKRGRNVCKTKEFIKLLSLRAPSTTGGGDMMICFKKVRFWSKVSFQWPRSSFLQREEQFQC